MSTPTEHDYAGLVRMLGHIANRRVQAAAQADQVTEQLRVAVKETAQAGVPISIIIGASGLNRSTIYTWLHRDVPELFTDDDEDDSRDET